MTSPGPVVRRWRSSLILLPVLAFVALGSWALSSPVGSSPDDDFHLASIWCGNGIVDGKCEAGDKADERAIARDLSVDAICFAYREDASAGCQGGDFGDNPHDTISTDRGNFVGQYPPVYYFAQGIFAGDNIELSVLLMRFVNSLLFVAMVTVLLVLLPRDRRTMVVWALAVTVVPLGLFIIPSTNPSGWAIVSAAVLWPSLAGYFEADGKRRIALGAYAAMAAAIGAGARSDSAVYVLLAVVIAAVLTFQRTKQYALLSILPAALSILAVAIYLASGQSGVVTAGFETADPVDYSPGALFIANFVLAPDLWFGMFASGDWGLGWLDTEMPSIVSGGAFDL